MPEFTKEELEMLTRAAETYAKIREHFYMHSIQKHSLTYRGEPYTKEQCDEAHEDFRAAVKLWLKLKEM